VKIYLLSAVGPSAIFSGKFKAISGTAFLRKENAEKYTPTFREACCDPSKGLDYAEEDSLEVQVREFEVADAD
jgi:hypothetical protein